MTRPASFDASVLALSANLRAYAMKLTRSRDHADDLVQETIAKALKAHAQYTGGINLAGWLITIMRNTWHEVRRRNRRLVEDPDGHAAMALIQSASQQARLGLQDVFARLNTATPASYREALLLTVAGESYDAVAAYQGVPIGTIKSRVNRARAVLEGVA